jgi:CRP-like cAMP-binding protein
MSRLLDELGDEERRHAQRALSGCQIVDVPPAGISEVPDAVLLVVEVGVVLLGRGESRRIVLAIAGPGEVLAPPGDGQELRGLTRACVTAVTRDAGHELMAVPGAAAAVARALMEAVGDRQESLANFARFPHAERVRGKLLQLARSHGRVVEDGVLIDVPLTHDLIAESIGSTRETVTLALRQLMRSGFVSRADRRYRVSVPPEELS